MKNSKIVENRWIFAVDKLVYFFGFIMVIMTLPQAFIIWYNKSAVDVSLLTWGTYTLMSSVMALYGFLHKKYPIMVPYFAVTIVEIFIIIGIIIY